MSTTCFQHFYLCFFLQNARASFGEAKTFEGRMRPRRHGRSRVQRIKRGWVWNQFFVLEEYMGSEPQYVGKVSRYLI
uniref:Cadherin N-terminal domain-containing protein n=1 Tax=Stegastes partitus TaxID=144197 RepID=A0A3B5BKY7_9TELE